MKMNKCAYCGKPVRVYPQTQLNHITGKREPHPLAGWFNRGGASRMQGFDPKGYFCKMECAVRYAVAIVNAVKEEERK